MFAAAAAAKSLQSCLTLCDPVDGSPPGSPVPGILQASTPEWVAISFSNAWKWKVKVKSLSCVRLLVTPWTAAYQAPPSMGFSRQEYWSGVPLPSPVVALSQLKNVYLSIQFIFKLLIGKELLWFQKRAIYVTIFYSCRTRSQGEKYLYLFSTVYLLHINLPQAANFQRCKCAFHQQQAGVKLQLRLTSYFSELVNNLNWRTCSQKELIHM